VRQKSDSKRWCYPDKGRLDEAIAEYREAIRIKPDYSEAHKNQFGMQVRER
jgi:hypothetical protein